MEMPGMEETLQILECGEVEVEGQFTYGSNYTFLVRTHWQEHNLPAVYKPSEGERPLWDFDLGTLAAREVAAFEVSRSLDWDFVPPTVLRQDGPAGPGSLQLYVESQFDEHYFTLSPSQKERLRAVAVFDILINNADRKGGHVLISPGDKLWLIDHGLSFHAQDKLRTVIWDFAGEPIPEPLLGKAKALRALLQSGTLRGRLRSLLTDREIEALDGRAKWLLSQPIFPGPGSRRPYPWPLV
jgi:hypothetical protein